MSKSTMEIKLHLCEVTQIIDPTRYVVQYLSRNFDSEYRLMESKIKGEWMSADNPIKNFIVGVHVAVRSTDHGPRRGIIREVLPINDCQNEYRVFVYDHGIFEDVKESNMIMLQPKFYFEMAPRSSTVTLPGLVPMRTITLLGTDTVIYVEASGWSQEKVEFVREWLQSGDIYVYKFPASEETNVIGDFYKDNDIVPLSEHLENQKYAKLDKGLVQRNIVGANTSQPDRASRSRSKPKASKEKTKSLKTQAERNKIHESSLKKCDRENTTPASSPTPAEAESRRYKRAMKNPRREDESIKSTSEFANIRRRSPPGYFSSYRPSVDLPSEEPRYYPIRKPRGRGRGKIQSPPRSREREKTPSPPKCPEPEVVVSSDGDDDPANTKLFPRELPAEIENTSTSSEIPVYKCFPPCRPTFRPLYCRGRGKPKPKETENPVCQKPRTEYDIDETVLNPFFVASDESESTSTDISRRLKLVRKILAEEEAEQQAEQQAEEAKEVKPQRTLEDIKRSLIDTYDYPGKILVRCSTESCPKPLSCLGDFPQAKLFEPCLKNVGILHLRKIQKYAWPHYMRGNNCFIIGQKSTLKAVGAMQVKSESSGKSLSYIVPLIGSLIMDYKTFKDGKGPVALILCSTFASANKLLHHVEELLAGLPEKYSLRCHIAFENDFATRNKLRNGAEILIASPDSATDMLLMDVPFLNFYRMQHLVFDDAHVIFKKAYGKLTTFLDEYKRFVTSREGKVRPLQLTVCGSNWDLTMEKIFQDVFPDPVLIIQSPFTAMAYAGVKVNVRHVTEDSKLDVMMEILEKDTMHKRIVILCSSEQNVHQVASIIRVKKISPIYVKNEATELHALDLKETQREWDIGNEFQEKVLVCTDSQLEELDVTDATCLIHYDMPEPLDKKGKLTIFGFRFKSMWKHIRDAADKLSGLLERQEATLLVSHVLLKSDTTNLNAVVKKFTNYGYSIPQSLIPFSDAAEKLERDRHPLCLGIKWFGRCNNVDVDDCIFRHYFLDSEILVTPAVPRWGEVELKLKKCYNPSLFYGQLVRYDERSDTGKIIASKSYTEIYEEMCRKLNEF